MTDVIRYTTKLSGNFCRHFIRQLDDVNLQACNWNSVLLHNVFDSVVQRVTVCDSKQNSKHCANYSFQTAGNYSHLGLILLFGASEIILIFKNI